MALIIHWWWIFCCFITVTSGLNDEIIAEEGLIVSPGKPSSNILPPETPKDEVIKFFEGSSRFLTNSRKKRQADSEITTTPSPFDEIIFGEGGVEDQGIEGINATVDPYRFTSYTFVPPNEEAGETKWDTGDDQTSDSTDQPPIIYSTIPSETEAPPSPVLEILSIVNEEGYSTSTQATETTDGSGAEIDEFDYETISPDLIAKAQQKEESPDLIFLAESTPSITAPTYPTLNEILQSSSTTLSSSTQASPPDEPEIADKGAERGDLPETPPASDKLEDEKEASPTSTTLADSPLPTESNQIFNATLPEERIAVTIENTTLDSNATPTSTPIIETETTVTEIPQTTTAEKGTTLDPAFYDESIQYQAGGSIKAEDLVNTAESTKFKTTTPASSETTLAALEIVETTPEIVPTTSQNKSTTTESVSTTTTDADDATTISPTLEATVASAIVETTPQNEIKITTSESVSTTTTNAPGVTTTLSIPESTLPELKIVTTTSEVNPTTPESEIKSTTSQSASTTITNADDVTTILSTPESNINENFTTDFIINQKTTKTEEKDEASSTPQIPVIEVTTESTEDESNATEQSPTTAVLVTTSDAKTTTSAGKTESETSTAALETTAGIPVITSTILPSEDTVTTTTTSTQTTTTIPTTPIEVETAPVSTTEEISTNTTPISDAKDEEGTTNLEALETTEEIPIVITTVLQPVDTVTSTIPAHTTTDSTETDSPSTSTTEGTLTTTTIPQNETEVTTELPVIANDLKMPPPKDSTTSDFFSSSASPTLDTESVKETTKISTTSEPLLDDETTESEAFPNETTSSVSSKISETSEVPSTLSPTLSDSIASVSTSTLSLSSSMPLSTSPTKTPTTTGDEASGFDEFDSTTRAPSRSTTTEENNRIDDDDDDKQSVGIGFQPSTTPQPYDSGGRSQLEASTPRPEFARGPKGDKGDPGPPGVCPSDCAGFYSVAPSSSQQRYDRLSDEDIARIANYPGVKGAKGDRDNSLQRGSTALPEYDSKVHRHTSKGEKGEKGDRGPMGPPGVSAHHTGSSGGGGGVSVFPTTSELLKAHRSIPIGQFAFSVSNQQLFIRVHNGFQEIQLGNFHSAEDQGPPLPILAEASSSSTDHLAYWLNDDGDVSGQHEPCVSRRSVVVTAQAAEYQPPPSRPYETEVRTIAPPRRIETQPPREAQTSSLAHEEQRLRHQQQWQHQQQQLEIQRQRQQQEQQQQQQRHQEDSYEQQRQRYSHVNPRDKVLHLIALNNPVNGKMHGIRGADLQCYQHARKSGFRTTFRAFLSSNVQDLRNLVHSADNDTVIVNSNGQKLFDSWNSIFNPSTVPYNAPIYSFDRKNIFDDNNWSDRYIWHGSDETGRRLEQNFCETWRSQDSYAHGMASAVLPGRPLITEAEPISCHRNLIVLCVENMSKYNIDLRLSKRMMSRRKL